MCIILKDSGVEMSINGKLYKFRGTISIVPADSLASHYLGRYKSLSSALRKCRHCMATADDMSTKVRLFSVVNLILIDNFLTSFLLNHSNHAQKKHILTIAPL